MVPSVPQNAERDAKRLFAKEVLIQSTLVHNKYMPIDLTRIFRNLKLDHLSVTMCEHYLPASLVVNSNVDLLGSASRRTTWTGTS